VSRAPSHRFQKVNSANLPANKMLGSIPASSTSSNVPEERAEVMILTPVSKPPLEAAPGHWVCLASDPDKEGLVHSVLSDARTLLISFPDDDPNKFCTVPFDNPDMDWFAMSNQEDEAKKIAAVTTLQAAMRGV
jgi:hypothetical protein